MTKRTYFPALDGVRAVAALMVMVFHAAQGLLPRPGVAALGQTGVDLFFVLSGFLITTILLGNAQGEWAEVRTFYARRSFRIFPLYFAFLLLYVVSGRPVGWPYWVYLQNFFVWSAHPLHGPEHLWSLAVEEQFYLVWPFLVLFAPRRWLLPVLWAMVAGAGVFRFLMFGHGEIYALTFTHIDGLAAGGILAVWFAREPLERHRGWLTAGLVFFTGISGVLAVRFSREQLVWFGVVKYWAIAGMYAFLLATILASPGWTVWRPLRSVPVRWLGRISYGLYVYHPAVFRMVFREMFWAPAWSRALTVTGVSVVIAAISWYGFERGFVRLKDRVFPEPRTVPEAAITVS